MSLRNRKYVPLAKHALDLKSVRISQQAINALLNAKVVQGNGQGRVHFSESNTVYEIPSVGFRWAAAGREYDMGNSYFGDTRGAEEVWIEATNLAVTAGVVDPDTGLNVVSTPGLWRALQAVTPVKNPTGRPPGTYYHIPQWPPPVRTNLFDPKNYWLLISPYHLCT